MLCFKDLVAGYFTVQYLSKDVIRVVLGHNGDTSEENCKRKSERGRICVAYQLSVTMPKKERKRNKKGTRRGDESSDDDSSACMPEKATAEQPSGRTKGKSKKNGGRQEFRFGDVDPRRIRFAHARIKPMFSGCGRSLEQTLLELQEGTTKVSAIPKITIMVGPIEAETGEPWYFSLNNRRLYVFKQLRESGFLETVPVRIRDMKVHERERYTVEKCGLNAKFLFRLDTTRNDDDQTEPLSTVPADSEALSAQPSHGTALHEV
eukprot:m.95206 g.95206  ORF g.95206 m.95206 type:complete len:263 (-) comp15010_c0_seq25:1496-2284(-)